MQQELDEGTTTIHTDCNVVQVQRAEMSAESSAINSLPEQQVLVSVTKYYIRKIDWHAVHVVCQFQAPYIMQVVLLLCNRNWTKVLPLFTCQGKKNVSH